MTLTILPNTAFLFMLIFARVGTMVMAMPGFGDVTISPRIRLALALALTLLMLPLVQEKYGPLPENIWAVLAMLAGEMVIGIFIGLSTRMIMSAVQVSGTIIAFQSSLGFAQSIDPSQGTQQAIFGSFMSMLAATLIFQLDLHHLLIAAIYDSYEIFQPGTLPEFGNFAEAALKTMSASFLIGVQMAAPFLVFGLVFYMGVGILARLMPQVQIFFVAVPANILLAFLLLLILLSTMMMWFFDHFAANVQQFIL